MYLGGVVGLVCLVELVALVALAVLAKQKRSNPLGLLLAVRTGLEPATPCVTGMYSNQLNYRTNSVCRTFFSKAGAKVLLFFDMTKYF